MYLKTKCTSNNNLTINNNKIIAIINITKTRDLIRIPTNGSRTKTNKIMILHNIMSLIKIMKLNNKTIKRKTNLSHLNILKSKNHQVLDKQLLDFGMKIFTRILMKTLLVIKIKKKIQGATQSFRISFRRRMIE